MILGMNNMPLEAIPLIILCLSSVMLGSLWCELPLWKHY